MRAPSGTTASNMNSFVAVIFKLSSEPFKPGNRSGSEARAAVAALSQCGC